jgi:sucrose phosphorylase
MIEESFEFVDELAKKANSLGMTTLAEIHSHYMTQLDIAKRVDMVYDFALPPLILHSLFSQDVSALSHWLSIAPRNCVTVLDTHDGIGIIDAGPVGNKAGLLTTAEIDNLVNRIHSNSKGESLQATGAAASNVDLYQVNCTYYDALGQNDIDYLIARSVQFFAPGIPQVYYTGLLAVPNAMELLNQTQVGRDINRPYLQVSDIQTAMQKPVVKALCELITLRNKVDAFNGEFTMTNQANQLDLCWVHGDSSAKLSVNFATKEAHINIVESQQSTHIVLTDLLAKHSG